MTKTYNKIRSIIAFLLILLWTGVLSLRVLLAWNKKKQDQIIDLWSKWVLRFCRIELDVKGRENLPKSGGFIILFNHLSLLDIPVIYQAIGCARPRFGAKSELFKVPIFGLALRHCGFLPIERQNREKTLAIYKKTKERFEKGDSFILAPEGTRQEEVNLGQFKSGPFILAIENQVEIVPIVLLGQEKICPKGSLLPKIEKANPVNIKILAPLHAKDYSYEKRQDLKELTKLEMQRALDSIRT